MRPPKTLHLLVSAPSQFVGDVDAALMVELAIGSVQRNPDRTGVADDGHPASALLELFHRMHVDPVHGNSFRRAFLVLDSAAARIANQAARPSSDLGYIRFAKVIDQLV